jgi:protein-tyrosine phosphatase
VRAFLLGAPTVMRSLPGTLLSSRPMIRILVVCLGNICRSPTASAVLQGEVQRRGLVHVVQVDSAGTYAGHQGEKADPRAIEVAMAAGYAQILQERARRLQAKDYEQFDLILAMDRDNLHNLQDDCPPAHLHKLHLFLDFAGVEAAGEVPDPYYGNRAGFERVLALCEAGARGVLDRLSTTLR